MHNVTGIRYVPSFKELESLFKDNIVVTIRHNSARFDNVLKHEPAIIGRCM